MAKTHAERQREYRNKQREKNETGYLEADRSRKRKAQAALKLNKEKHAIVKAKDRQRKRKGQGNESTNSSPITSTPQNFKNNQSFGKATARAARNLPQSPREKAAVISHLVSNLSPSSKKNVFESARKKLTSYMGRPTIPEETRKALVSFLERPDISYCKPGRGDTVYCGKNQAGEKNYKSKHYLLWTLKGELK